MRKLRDFAATHWKNALAMTGILIIGYVYGVIQGPSTEDYSEKPRKAADFALPDLSGKTVRLSDFKGKVVLVDFWATFCLPCLDELPDLKALYRKYESRGFTIVSISKDFVAMEEVASFVKEFDVRYPSLYGGLDLLEGYPVRGLPTAYLINREGLIVKRYIGYKFPEELEKDILSLLKTEVPNGTT